jgi:toxin secretion/phage lysis holin
MGVKIPEVLRDAVCIGFILNEAVSILENAGLMGVKIPEVLRSRIDVLRKEEQSK